MPCIAIQSTMHACFVRVRRAIGSSRIGMIPGHLRVAPDGTIRF